MLSMDTKNFDNIVKSMMEGAQEEVSSRVWSGVQKGLEAAAARRSRIVFFRRAGYSLAAVAAAVALLLTTGLFRDNSIQPTISEKAIALIPETPTEDIIPQDSGREGLQTIPQNPKVARKTYIKEVVSNNVEEIKNVQLKEEEPIRETVEAVLEKTDSDKKVFKEEKENKTDFDAEEPQPFTAWDEPSAVKKNAGRVRLSVGGNVGNNGVRTSSFSPTARRANQSAQNRNIIRENGESSYSFPISFGLGISFPLAGNFSIGTGLNYTSLSRTFPGKYLAYDEATGTQELLYGDARHSVKYIGIPVNIYYNFPAVGNFHFYTYGGGEIERSFQNRFRITTNRGKISTKVANKGVQLSVGAGVGAEFMITNHIGLYVDPSVKYYFDCNQPKSVRTQHPWMFNVEAGFRFNL